MDLSYQTRQPYLSDLCVFSLLQHPEAWLIANSSEKCRWSLKQHIYLTRMVCEQILSRWSRIEQYQSQAPLLPIASIFANIEQISLGGSLELGWAKLSVQELRNLLHHQPLRVYAHNVALCEDNLFEDFVPEYVLSNLSRTLEELDIGGNSMYLSAPPVGVQFPQLRLLSAHGICEQGSRTRVNCSLNQLSVTSLLSHFPALVILDLSNSTFLADDAATALTQLAPQLRCLVLHRCEWFFAADLVAPPPVPFPEPLPKVNVSGLHLICLMSNLRVLDISMPQKFGQYLSFRDSERACAQLAKALPLLESLNISFTNLSGFLPDDMNQGLPGFHEHHLTFLGLYGCPYQPFNRLKLPVPANRVSGSGDLTQFLTALRTWLDYPVGIYMVLDDFFQEVRDSQVIHNARSVSLEELEPELFAELIDLLTYILVKYWFDRHSSRESGVSWSTQVQISGSAVLFYFIKALVDCEALRIAVLNKRREVRLLRAILTALTNFPEISESTIVRNSLLSLSKFRQLKSHSLDNNKLDDVLINHLEELTNVLLDQIKRHHGQNAFLTEDFVERLSLFVLNSLCISAVGVFKAKMGVTWGVIKTMLSLIHRLIDRQSQHTDERFNQAWSILWNITDETCENSECFVHLGGLEVFRKCYELVPGVAILDGPNDEMRRNMMGLLGNIAEVSSLRPRLRNEAWLLHLLIKLSFKWRPDDVETAYNAAGVLAHLLCDGEWPLVEETFPTREQATAALIENTSSWPLDVDRQINYHSFIPILRLVDALHAPAACQFWALWALTNLSHKSPERYVELLKQEEAPRRLEEYLTSQSKLNVHKGSASLTTRGDCAAVCTRLPCEWARRTLRLLREWSPNQH